MSKGNLKESAASFLKPGEQLQFAIRAQTWSPRFEAAVASNNPLRQLWIGFKNIYAAVVITDRRILVCRLRHYRPQQIKEIIRELPRSTVIITTPSTAG